VRWDDRRETWFKTRSQRKMKWPIIIQYHHLFIYHPVLLHDDSICSTRYITVVSRYYSVSRYCTISPITSGLMRQGDVTHYVPITRWTSLTVWCCYTLCVCCQIRRGHCINFSQSSPRPYRFTRLIPLAFHLTDPFDPFISNIRITRCKAKSGVSPPGYAPSRLRPFTSMH